MVVDTAALDQPGDEGWAYGRAKPDWQRLTRVNTLFSAWLQTGPIGFGCLSDRDADDLEGTTIMARNARAAARAVAIQQNAAAEAATRWLFVAAGLAAAIALAGALALVAG